MTQSNPSSSLKQWHHHLEAHSMETNFISQNISGISSSDESEEEQVEFAFEKDMLAAEIAVEPYVIKCTREYFFKSASLSVSPTKRGFSLIKEGHPLYPFKFVKNKPVFSFEKDQFAVLILGALNNLVTINFPSGTVGAFTSNFAQKLELFQTGGSRGEHKIWNSLLNRVFDIALNEVIVPMLIEELKSKLLKEALEYVCKTSCQQLRNWLKV